MKKTIAILLCALFILSAVPTSIFAAPEDLMVTFAPMNGIPPADPPFTVPVASGEKVIRPTPDPVYEGHDFIGWYTTLTNTLYDFDTPVTSNLFLFAMWVESGTVTQYTVTFDPNNGGDTFEVDVNDGEKVAIPEGFANLTHSIYSTLIGWYTEDDELWDFDDDIVTDDLILTAKWGWTVKFAFLNGTPPKDPTLEVKVANGTKVERPIGPTYDGYDFDGWCIKFTTNLYNFDTSVMSDLDLYAIWAPAGTVIQHTVTFNPNNGAEPIVVVVRDGYKLSKPSDPLYDGFDFDGWYIDEDLSEEWDFDTPITTDLDLFAKWTPKQEITKYAVTFDPKNDDDPIIVAADPGDMITIPEGFVNLTHEIYSTLVGWYVNDDVLWDFDEDTVTDNLTLTAKWGWTVVFAAVGGEELYSLAIVDREKIEPQNDPEPIPDGYKFEGWYIHNKEKNEWIKWEFDLDVVTEDITLEAKLDNEIGTIPTLSVGSVVGINRNTTAVPVTASDSPLLASLKFVVVYDADALVLTDVILPSNSGFSALIGPDPGQDIVSLVPNGADSVDPNGALLSITFEISKNAVLSEYLISLQNIKASDEEDIQIQFSVEDGSVKVVRYGDFTGNREVDGNDILWINRYIQSLFVLSEMIKTWTTPITTFCEPAADFTNNGDVDGTDILWIHRYIAANEDPQRMVSIWPTSIDFSHIGVENNMVSSTISIQSVALDENIVYMIPNKTDVPTGEIFNLTIGVDLLAGMELSSLWITLDYDQSMLRLVTGGISYPSNFTSSSVDPFYYTLSPKGSEAQGSGDVMILTFEVLDASMEAEIRLTVNRASNPDDMSVTLLRPATVVINPEESYPDYLEYTVEYYYDDVMDESLTEIKSVPVTSPVVTSVTDNSKAGYRAATPQSYPALPTTITKTNNRIKVYYVSVIPWMVTFTFDNGDTNLQVAVDDSEMVNKPIDPQKPGFDFVGWFNGNALYDFNAPVTGDLTLIAVWKPVSNFIPVTSIKIDAPAQVTVIRASKYTFTVTLNPGATSEGVIWTVTPIGFATVNTTTGEVFTQNKTGTVVLTATDIASGLSSNIILRII